MKMKTIQELDKLLRKINVSGVYGPWDDKNQFFSIGEGADNVNAYPGNTPETENNCQAVLIQNRLSDEENFVMTHLKNDSNGETIEITRIKKILGEIDVK